MADEPEAPGLSQQFREVQVRHTEASESHAVESEVNKRLVTESRRQRGKGNI
jgi:hypothetical protein